MPITHQIAHEDWLTLGAMRYPHQTQRWGALMWNPMLEVHQPGGDPSSKVMKENIEHHIEEEGEMFL
jgi:hypothetical protein